MFCTSAAEPIVKLESLPEDALITSTTTSGAGAHDVPIELLAASYVYCDNRDTTPEIAGEMTSASAKGLWHGSSIRADLGDLLTGKGDVRTVGRRYFRSVGIGTEEIAIASIVLDHLAKESS
jgi:L-arginine dehydrogenase